MEKWELARYLIDAKKSVDAILYLAQHGEKVSMLNIRNVVNELRRTFYVNVCVALDKCFPKEKKEICKNPTIKSVYYERDKNYAHKDENYVGKEYSSMAEIANDMKQQLGAVHQLCASFLPDVLTLDYLPFDSNLFRIANGVTKEKEEAALNIKHPLRRQQIDLGKIPQSQVYSVLTDTEDIKKIPMEKRNEYATIMQTGINTEETLQKLQDACITTNAFYGTEIWVSLGKNGLSEVIKLRKQGLIDELDVPIIPKNQSELRKIWELLREEGIL